MLEDRIDQMATVKKVFDDGEWLTAKDINKLQIRPPRKVISSECLEAPWADLQCLV